MRYIIGKIKKLFLSRTFIIGSLLLLQLMIIFAIIFLAAYNDFKYSLYLQYSLHGLSIIIALYILTRDKPIEYKLSWVVPILILPVFGGLFYLLYNTRNYSKKAYLKSVILKDDRKKIFEFKEGNLLPDEIFCANEFWPTYNDTEITYLSSGEKNIETLIEDLKKARKFIFLEFFIIKKGKIWNKILKILKEKAKEKVEIYVLYDDFGSIDLDYKYYNKLRKFKINANAFNHVKPRLNFKMNYRNHRKICVIDGIIGYTGGYNLADEYANEYERFGYWNDSGCKIYGTATNSLTYMFIADWYFESGEKLDYNKYFTRQKFEDKKSSVIPIADTPLEKNYITKNMYLQMINKANSSIYIATPYLIIDNNFINALVNAQNRGVDVNIIIPKVPDKKMVYMVSLSYSENLIENNIKVYQFLPGFIHSKVILIDNKTAMVGTSNFDYRSLYLNFENNLWFNDNKEIKKVEENFKDLIKVSKLISLENLKNKNIFYKFLQIFLRGFSTLL